MQGRNADALALYFGEDPTRCPFEQGDFTLYKNKIFLKVKPYYTDKICLLSIIIIIIIITYCSSFTTKPRFLTFCQAIKKKKKIQCIAHGLIHPSNCYFSSSYAVVSTLLNFVRMFGRAQEENCKQIELEKKKAQKESENVKMKLGVSKKEPENLLSSPPLNTITK